MAKRAAIAITIGLLVFCISSAWAGGSGEEAPYPSRPVTVVVPWAAGGGTDMIARAIMSVMSSHFPQPMVVVNKPGAGSVVGFTEALQAPADGYTIIVTGIGTSATQPLLQDVEYSPDDYEVVLQVSSYPRILAARNDAPYDSLPELMEYARNNPGQVVAGIAAVGTTGHFGVAQLALDNNVEFNMIPQGGGGPQRTALIGGHIDIAPLEASTGGPTVRDGLIKALAILDNERFDGLPDVPTAAELGFPVVSGISTHVYVRSGTPADRVQIIHDAFNAAIEDPAFLAIAARLDLGIQYKPGGEAIEDILGLLDTYERVARGLGLR